MSDSSLKDKLLFEISDTDELSRKGEIFASEDTKNLEDDELSILEDNL